MEINEQRHGAVTVIKPVGPLVQGDATQFRTHVQEVMTRSLGRFVVDASSIPFVDSAGLEAMLAATEELASGGRALRLCAATDTVREVLELTGLNDRFEHFLDVNMAVRSFLA
ncbi:MAG: STAS domain-containing protein [Tepidisphaera sp.]|nr:STAS domain-containing protein [Tepidisphaera sp.]